MNDKIKYWFDISEYDYETAKAILDTGRYLYVGFMCHQAIEKILKAYWQKIKEQIPPKTHNLLYFVTETGLRTKLSDSQLDFIDELDPLNITSRYPESYSAVFERIDHKECESLYLRTGEFLEWIKKKLL